MDITIDAVVHKIFTKSKGAYTVKGVPYNATVALRATKYPYSFSTIASFSMLNHAVPRQDFSAIALTSVTSAIRGTIKLGGLTPLANVPVSLTYNSDLIFSTKTASDGSYTFPNLYAGSGYVVQPKLANYVFDPLSQPVDLSEPPTSHDFSATRVAKLSGKISGLPAGTTPIEFDISGGLTSSAPIPLDSLGRYTIPNLPTGASYTVTPVLDEYIFIPPTSTFLIGTTTTLITRNFTAAHS